MTEYPKYQVKDGYLYEPKEGSKGWKICRSTANIGTPRIPAKDGIYYWTGNGFLTKQELTKAAKSESTVPLELNDDGKPATGRRRGGKKAKDKDKPEDETNSADEGGETETEQTEGEGETEPVVAE